MTARFLWDLIKHGDPLDTLYGLQNAHDAILNQRVKQQLVTILRNYRAGKLPREDIAQVVGMDTKNLDELFRENPST